MEKKKVEPIRVGIIGLGRAGGLNPDSWNMHPEELAPRRGKFRIVAACDVVKARRDRMAAAYGCKTYARAEDLAADPDVELVDVASRTADHVAHALLGLRAGKDVFLEKPIARTYSEAKNLKTGVSRSKGRLFIRHNRRFEPAFTHIREILATGVLGEVFEVKLHRNGYQRRDDWQTLIAHGGGQLLNWGPHIVDHALRLLESPVAELWSDLKRVAAVGDAEDHLKIVLKGENGRVVDLEISGGAALGEPEYVILGTKGALTCDEREIHLRYLDPEHKLPRRRAKAGTPGEKGGGGGPDALKWIDKTLKVRPRARCDTPSIWDHLYEAIRNGKPFPITLEESLEVMRVISLVKKGTEFEAKAG